MRVLNIKKKSLKSEGKMSTTANNVQIREITKFQKHLKKILRHEIDIEQVAIIWIDKYAKLWREHNYNNFTHAC